MVYAAYRRAVLPLLGLSLAACTAGPAYQPPTAADLGVPPSWRGEAVEPVTPEDLSRWWDRLGDAHLTALIEAALRRNPDLDSARAGLRAARARLDIADAGGSPQVSASASAGAGKNGGSPVREQYQAGFDASWEPDVFGGRQRAVEAAGADRTASALTLASARVSLAAEVARNYLQFRAYQLRLDLARRHLATQQETRELTAWRVRAGLAGQTALEQAVTAAEQTRAQIPVLESGMTAAENRLAILTGQAPGAWHDRLSAVAPLPELPVSLVIGIPADTLRQRPDVQAAERRLAAETARIGVAEAGRYPSFRLSGSLGLEAATLSGLGGASAPVRSLLAGISAPLLDGGRLRGQVTVQSAVRDQALADYRAIVLTALEDVENALATLAAQQRRLAALTTGTEAAVNAAELARQRYLSGLADYQTVLDTERSRLSLEDSRQACAADLALALVQLYKALGGGWTPAAPDTLPDSGSPT